MYCQKSSVAPRIHVIVLLAGVLAIPLAPMIYSQLVAQDPVRQTSPPVGALIQSPDEPSGGAGSATSQPAERTVKEILNQRIDINFQEAALSDVLEYLRDALNVQIVTKIAPLNETGITLDVPITMHLKSVRASLALELILGAANQSQLTYYTRDNLIIVTTKDDLTNTLTTRIYDVRALNNEASAQAPAGAGGSAAGSVGMSSMMGGMRGGAGMRSSMGGMDSRSMMSGGGMRSGGFSGSSSPQVEVPASVEPLTEIIQSVVEPQSWEMNGGPGAVRSFNGLLIVRQSDRVHAQIEDLLAEMQSIYGNQ